MRPVWAVAVALSVMLAPGLAEKVPSSVPGHLDRAPAPSIVKSGSVSLVCWLERAGSGVEPAVLVGQVSGSGLQGAVKLVGPRLSSKQTWWSVAPYRASKDSVELIWALPVGDDRVGVYLVRVSKGGKGWSASFDPVRLYDHVPVVVKGGDGFPVCAVASLGGDRVLVAYYSGGSIRARVLEHVSVKQLGKKVWRWALDQKTGLPWELEVLKGVSKNVWLRVASVTAGKEVRWVLSVFDPVKGVSKLVVLRPSGSVVAVERVIDVPGKGLAVVYPGRLPVPVLVCAGGALKAYVLTGGWKLSGGAALAQGLPGWVRVPGLARWKDGYAAVVGGNGPRVIVFGLSGNGVSKRYEVSLPVSFLYRVSASNFGGWMLVAGYGKGGLEVLPVNVQPPSSGGGGGPVLPFVPVPRRRRE